jgi:hypothetical protein
MTEQPNGPEQPARKEESTAEGTGERADRVRTEGETAVDDAMGAGDNVH